MYLGTAVEARRTHPNVSIAHRPSVPLVLLDVRGVTSPDGLLLVEKSPLMARFLNLLSGRFFILFFEVEFVVFSALFFPAVIFVLS